MKSNIAEMGSFDMDSSRSELLECVKIMEELRKGKASCEKKSFAVAVG